MQRFKSMFLLWSCIAVLALLLTIQGTGVQAAARKQSPHKTPPTPAASTSVVSTLFGITALSEESIWAVGTSMNVPQFTGQPLTEHWDGNTWHIIPGPAIPQNELNTLVSVTAVTNTNVWAVGFSMNKTKLADQPLIEHWNGQSWQIVPTTTSSGGLSAITALGPDDIWAVGSTYSPSGASSEALIEHWNGNTWQAIPAASTADNSSLLSITAVSANDIWAVGSTSSKKDSKALIEHWNGSNWQAIPTPASSMTFNKLSGVMAISDHDIWAVGNNFSQPLQVHPSIEHWDGNTWSAVSTSGLPASFAPTAISALSADNIWIVGAQTLAHWNGKSWRSFPITSQKGFNFLNALTTLARDNTWAVGFSLETKNAAPLIEHWNGSNWQVILSPSPAFKKAPNGKITKVLPKHK